MIGKHVKPRNTVLRLAAGGVLAGIVMLVVIVMAPKSDAAARSINVPGIDVCKKNAPFAHTPKEGLAGLLGERPVQITTDTSPDHIWSTGGFAGMTPHTYDLGCALDPTSWMRTANASTDASISGAIVDVGNSLVSITDSVDRRAWQPGWITGFLKGFTDRAAKVINERILIPFVAIGLLVAAAIIFKGAHYGDVSGMFSSIGWIMLVLLTSTIILAAPLTVSRLTQSGAGHAVATLNGGANASDATTNDVVYSVEYQGWLRRTFGADDTDVGRKYGPDLLASLRVSWSELATANTPAKRNALVEAKAADFKSIAAKVKAEDPIAYRSLTGENTSSGESLAELAFAAAASLFRLAVSILMIACSLTLVLLAIFWLICTPVLLIPEASGGRRMRGVMSSFSGQELGRTLFTAAVRAVVYVIQAAIGSWLFIVYMQACLAPGLSLWWSLLMLIIGSAVAWVAISPVKKLLSILSWGKIRGYGFVGRAINSALLGLVAGTVAGHAAKAETSDDTPSERMSEDEPSAPIHEPVFATIYTPAPRFVPETPTHVDGDPLPAGPGPIAITSVPHYERPVSSTDGKPSAPPDDSGSPYIPYETDDREGSDHAH